MYKDREKQKEANRIASQKRRNKGMTQGMTEEGMTVPEGSENAGEMQGVTKLPFKEVPPSYFFTEDGGYIDVRKLVDPEWRGMIEFMLRDCDHRHLACLRIRVGGGTILEYAEALECTR